MAKISYAKGISIALNLLPLIFEVVETLTVKGHTQAQALDLAVAAVKGALTALVEQNGE